PSELQHIAAGDKQYCRNLIDRWETPIKVIASSYASWQAPLPDLMQVGRIAVYKAALKYNPTSGVLFANYAKRAIRNGVVQEAARLVRQRQFETPLDYDLGTEEVSLADVPDDSDKIDLVREWVKDLPEPHATIFQLLYVEGLTQRDAAEQLGVSQP